jgi:hypothetical protein
MAAKFRYKAGAQGVPRENMVGTMSDESFIREVNQELRQEKAKALWDRFGPIAIAIAVLVVLATAAVVTYQWWVDSRADASGDAFAQAVSLAKDGKQDEALKALDDLEATGYGAYPLLARMRAGTALADKGDFAGAVAQFDEVAADTSIPQAIRDVAKLRAGYVLVDNGSYEDVSKRVEVLTDDTNALRHSAREALGLAAWKGGKTKDALVFFDQIVADEAAPTSIRERAGMMSELITGSGGAS